VIKHAGHFVLHSATPKIMNTHPGWQMMVTAMLLHFATCLNGQLVNINYSSQSLYIATRNGKEIGWLKASRSETGNDKFLTTESNLAFNVLISFEAKAITANKFKGNILVRAGVYRTLNGRRKLNNELELAEGKYKIVKGEAGQPITRPITNTVVSIYFREPAGITEIFSEVYLCFIQLKKIGPAVYETLLPDGGSMIYSYSMGRLAQITAKTSYGTVQFDLKH